MNGNYYQNPVFPNQSNLNSQVPNQQIGPPANNYNQSLDMGTPSLPLEQSYIENILRFNKGKVATFYMSFSDSLEWRDKSFTGVIEQSGRDHIILSDPKTGKWYLLLLIYLDYVVFEEKINYNLPLLGIK
jgi:spore germination protein Q